MIGVLGALCFLLGIFYYRDSRGFQSEYTNKNLLVSGDMINKAILDYQAPEKSVGYQEEGISISYLNVYDSHKHTQLLENIKIDQLVQIPKEEWTSFSDLKWLATLHFRYQDEVLLKLHIYQDSQRTYFLFNQNPVYWNFNSGDFYYYDGLMEIGLQIFVDDLNRYNFAALIIKVTF